MVTREEIIKFLILHTSDLQFNSLFCHAHALAFLMEGLLVLMDTKNIKMCSDICSASYLMFYTEIIRYMLNKTLYDIKYYYQQPCNITKDLNICMVAKYSLV